MAADGELRVLDRVQVPIECLDGEARAHVPDREGAVRTARDEEVRVRLEGKRVHGVRVRTVLLPLLQGVQVKELNSAISASAQHEIASVVELDLPNGPGMHVGERVCDSCAHEIP